MIWLGVDTGGTFTDFVVFDGEGLRIHKVLSTPEAPERAILQGLKDLDLPLDALRVIHGSTVATNALLEGKGAKTAYVTNRGLGDVLTIGRQARAELYNLTPEPQPPPVPGEYCFEVDARLGADGAELQALSDEALAELREQIRAAGVEAAAVNLLFCFLDERQERAIEDALADLVYVARASRVLPEYKEYERGIATWINASLGPLMAGYLDRLREALAPAPLSVMQSSGGTVAAEAAADRAVHLLLSGPAGGLTGARFVGEDTGSERLLTFDMGGTSTDVALVEGEPALTTEGRIGPYPVGVPMVDMHTIGAGGGSIARVDAGGLLQVGPASAGAEPGPACYGRGGEAATVTDAHVALGRLPAQVRLGGGLALDRAASQRVLARLGEGLGLSPEAAARGVLRLADEHMAQALRLISVQRGVDVRQHTLVCFGGAGGLHVCRLAEAMGMRRAIVPLNSGVLSALGMLVAPRRRELSRSVIRPLAEADVADLEAVYTELAETGRAELAAEGVEPASVTETRSVDLRYQGQAYSLSVDWAGGADLEARFHQRHRARFGHALELPVELVNLRAGLRGPVPELALPERAAGAMPAPVDRVPVVSFDEPVACYNRASLPSGASLPGPAIIIEPIATTFVEPGWRVFCDTAGHLVLESA